MKFNYSPAPNFRGKSSVQQIMRDLLLGLLVVYVFALTYYGVEFGLDYLIQAIVIMVVSVASCVGTEALWALANKKDVLTFIKTSFPVITGVILGLMMPINIHWYAVAISGILCTLFGKLVFGGFGQNIFNPAAVGRAISIAAFSGLVVEDVVTKATPTTIIATTYNWCVTDTTMVGALLKEVGGLTNLFLGWHPGALGETSALLLLIVGAVLAFRKVIDWRVPVVYIGGVFVLTTIMALFKGMGMWYPVYHLLTGSLIFGAIFMATDPVTTPTSAGGRVIYALGCAILTVLIRVKANLPEGTLYAILIMNACSPMIERACDCQQITGLKKTKITFAAIALVGIASCVLAISVVEPAKKPEPAPAPVVVTLDETNDFVQEFVATVNGTTNNDDGSVTYAIACDGYAVKFYEGGVPNEFEVTVKDGAVVSVVVTKASDTPYVGDKIKSDAKFLEQFVGLTKDDLKVDAIATSTISSASAYKAVLTALGQ